MNTTTTPVLNLAALVAELAKRGYAVTQDVVHLVYGRKEFLTAVGPREATICVYKANPGSVCPTYYSEGRNILESCGWDFRNDVCLALDLCERQIDTSYARRIFLRESARAAGEVRSC